MTGFQIEMILTKNNNVCELIVMKNEINSLITLGWKITLNQKMVTIYS